MRVDLFSICLLAIAIPLAPPVAQALTAEAICDRAFEQFGVRPAHCLAPVPVTPMPTNRNSGGLREEVLESHIFFEGGGAVLDDDAQVQLAVLLAVLETPLMRSACLRLIGHSDSSGGEAANMALGAKRAAAVAALLREGLKNNARLLEVTSAGESQPLADVAGSSALNRRVEIQAKTCP